ncbi:MAG TPA: choice-of-anchor Q domain-containing protein [Pyrinomonadaceae bacterium]|nr:choice-of-anchor Q domain-containing protein [Pyrinomonadaceae bacterium]
MSFPLRACRALAAACLLTLVLSASHSASAATFAVNHLGDTNDSAAGNGTCADSAGKCTLRAAITEANALAGDDTLNFSVAGTINLTGGSTPDLESALYINSNITINGPGASLLTVRRDTGGDYRIFRIAAGATVHISGLTVSNGRVVYIGDAQAGSCGGINSQGTLTLTGVTVSGNVVDGGGGGICNDDGELTIKNSTVSGNTAGGGGGIVSYGTIEIENSTVSGNTALGEFGGILSDYGLVTIKNSTISGNTAGFYCGGIYIGLYGSENATLTSVTVTANRADPNGSEGGMGGGIVLRAENDTVFTLRNSIVWGNYKGADTPDDFLVIFAPYPNAEYNLIGASDPADAFFPAYPFFEERFNQVGVEDAMLGPLADNGGPTKTHKLLPGSPAIDQGNSFGLTTDQRFYSPRISDNPDSPDGSGDLADIGAYDTGGLPPADMEITKRDSVDPAPVGSSFDYELRVYNRGPGPAPNVVVTDTVPAGLTVTGVSMHASTDYTGSGCSFTGNAVNCQLGTMRVFDNTFDGTVKKGKALIYVTVTASQVGQYANEATVSGGVADLSPSNNTGRQTTTVLGVSSVTVTPNTVPGGSNCQKPVVQVTLSGVAPYDTFVEVSDDIHGGTDIPPDTAPLLLRIPQGQSSATLLVTTAQVGDSLTGQVTARYGSSSVFAPLTLRPIGVKSLTVSPTGVEGGTSATATVNLECIPSQPLSVILKSSKPSAAKFINPPFGVAANPVTVQMGAKQAAFSVETYAVAANAGVNISAEGADGVQRNDRLDVLAPSP